MNPQSTQMPLPTSGHTGVAAPRRRRWPFVLGGLAALLAIPVAIYFYLSWAGDRDLAAAIAEIERTDPRWRFDDMQADRPAIAAADNPAVIVKRTDALLRPGDYDIGQKNWRLLEDLPPACQMDGRQIEALRVALTRHAEALKIARTLRDLKGEGRFVVNYEPSYLTINTEPLQRCRGVMAMLQHDAMHRAQAGDGDGSLQSFRAILVTARAIGDEPFLIAALIRFAGDQIAVATLERVLAQGEPSAAELTTTQSLLAKEIVAPTLLNALRGERAGFDRFIAGLDDGNVKLAQLVGGPGGLQSWVIDHFPVVVTYGRPEYLRLMTKAVEATKLPPEKQAGPLNGVTSEARESRAIAVRLLMPAVTNVGDANRRNQANLRCAMVGIAAERHRLKHGHWPKMLADLVQNGFLDTVPVDPIDGQPLRYKALPDGIVIYSIGSDGVDNGGNVDRDRPREPGTDLGIRLWNADARRQPPLPPRLDEGGAPP